MKINKTFFFSLKYFVILSLGLWISGCNNASINVASLGFKATGLSLANSEFITDNLKSFTLSGKCSPQIIKISYRLRESDEWLEIKDDQGSLNCGKDQTFTLNFKKELSVIESLPSFKANVPTKGAGFEIYVRGESEKYYTEVFTQYIFQTPQFPIEFLSQPSPSSTQSLASFNLNTQGSVAQFYIYKFLTSVSQSCEDPMGYSAQQSLSQKSMLSLTTSTDGYYSLCIIGSKYSDNFINYSYPTEIKWRRDSEGPRPKISRMTGQNAATKDFPVHFMVQFGEPIDAKSFTVDDILLASGSDAASGPTWTIVPSSDASQFILELNQIALGGYIEPYLSAGSVKDEAGNLSYASQSATTDTNSTIYPKVFLTRAPLAALNPNWSNSAITNNPNLMAQWQPSTSSFNDSQSVLLFQNSNCTGTPVYTSTSFSKSTTNQTITVTSGTYWFHVKSSDVFGTSSTSACSSTSVIVDMQAPTAFTITGITGGSSDSTEDQYLSSLTSPSEFQIHLNSYDGADYWKTVIKDGTGTTTICTLSNITSRPLKLPLSSCNLNDNNSYLVQVTAYDSAGNATVATNSGVFSFFVDTSLPASFTVYGIRGDDTSTDYTSNNYLTDNAYANPTHSKTSVKISFSDSTTPGLKYDISIINTSTQSNVCQPITDYVASNGTNEVTLNGCTNGFLQGTSYTLKVFAKKISGSGLLVTKNILFDSMAPQITSFALSAGSIYATSTLVQLNIASSDTGSGLDKMEINQGNTCGSENWTIYSANPSFNIATGSGDKSVALRVKDKAGHISSCITDSIYLDMAAPNSLSLSINGGLNYTNVTAATLTLSASDAASGVDKMKINEGDFCDSGTWVPYATTQTMNLSAGEGTKTVSVIFVDRAGNLSTCQSDTIFMDTASPSLTSISLNSGLPYTSVTSATLKLTASDSGSGIAFMSIYNNSNCTGDNWETYSSNKTISLLAGNGLKDISVRVKDAMGLVSGCQSSTITVDSVAPTISTLSINSGALYTNSTNISVSLSGTDATSGISKMYLSSGYSCSSGSWMDYATSSAMTLSTTNGLQYVSAYLKDNAGNSTSTSCIYDSITFDNQAPSSLSLSINNGAANTNNPLVSLAISAYDGTSGLSEMMISEGQGCSSGNWEAYTTYKTITLTGSDGSKDVSIKFKDKANNVSSCIFDSIILDTTNPTLNSISLNGGQTHTNNANATLSVSATDSGSGVYEMMISNTADCSVGSWTTYNTTVTGPLPNSTVDGTKTVSVKVRDALNNESGCLSTSIILDTAYPNLTGFTLDDGGYFKHDNSTTPLFSSNSLPENNLTVKYGYSLKSSNCSPITQVTNASVTGTEINFAALTGLNLNYFTEYMGCLTATDAAGNLSAKSATGTGFEIWPQWAVLPYSIPNPSNNTVEHKKNGFASSISPDGKIMVIGDPYCTYNGFTKGGCIDIYKWNGSSWIYTLTNGLSSANAFYGFSVAVDCTSVDSSNQCTSDDYYIAVGSPRNDETSNYNTSNSELFLHIFNSSSNTLTSTLSNSSISGKTGRFGFSVSIDTFWNGSQSVTLLAAGVPWQGTNDYGSVAVFYDMNDLNKRSIYNASLTDEHFGYSVAISKNYFIVTSQYSNSRNFSLFSFDTSNHTISAGVTKLVSLNFINKVDIKVDSSNNGWVAAADQTNKKVYLFQFNNGDINPDWTNPASTIDESTYNLFGSSIKFNKCASGNLCLVVGASGSNKAFVYENNSGTNWVTKSLSTNFGSFNLTGHQLGASVSAGGNQMVFGAQAYTTPSVPNLGGYVGTLPMP